MTASPPSGITIYRVSFASIVQQEELSRFESELKVHAGNSAEARLAIDFSKTFHVSSRALGLLVSTYKEIRGRRGRLVLFGTTPAVEKVFEITRLNTVIPLARDEQQAIGMLRS
jgi:anti-anti-sigma factor